MKHSTVKQFLCLLEEPQGANLAFTPTHALPWYTPALGLSFLMMQLHKRARTVSVCVYTRQHICVQ